MSCHEPYRTGTIDHHSISRLHIGQFCGMIAGRKNIRQHHIIIFFFFSIFRQFEAIKIGIGHPHKLCLSALIWSHASKTISGACHAGVHGKTITGKPFFAIAAMPACHVKRHTDHISHLYLCNTRTYFYYFTHIFVAQYATLFHISAAFIHVEVRAANIGRGYFYNHICWLLNLRIGHVCNPYIKRTIID